MNWIDRSSPLPLYHQLKQALITDIATRRLAPGDVLPGDHALCAAYDVSRTVVRQALTELEYEGVVVRVKGKGTFVAAPKTSAGLVQSLTGLFEDVAAHGGHLRSEVRDQRVVPSDAQVSADLGLRMQTPVVRVERLRFVGAEPWVLTVTHLPHELVAGLEHEDLTEQSLYAVLARDHGVEPVRGRRSVEATSAGQLLAEALGIPVGAAVLTLRSLSYDASGRPLETFVAHHRGDRSRFEVDLLRTPPASR
ncbi:GntR family transcriptional regulator [Pseudonocardia spinosispora]|uniref:GntR family transcriptional regulator n=1 Tax=Pseudonocardia spinosispora TaxID=103441 RepID=UPI000411F320|nr:GntR family transcriptional regulator [Pseudonocardia spinosispora]